MFEFVIQAILEFFFEAIWLILLWPVVMSVCTPFILFRAAVVVMTDKERFYPTLAGGYSAVSDFWMRIA